jgi:hypothetical protein
MKFDEKTSVKYLLWLIVILGAALRLFHLNDWSLTNDELSAITRTQHDSNLSLWLSYASAPDTHPPLVQFFIYNWTLLFGFNQVALRIPFIIFGIVCIPLSYRVFRMWFSDITAVYVAAGIGLLQYPILYSQMARPYSVGLLFMLLFTYYWTKLVLLNRYNFKTYLLYILIGICSLYIHYFLSLNIFILGVSGLFLIKKYRRKTYLIINTIVAIGFLPYLKYFLIQLKIGGVGDWLPLPEFNFYLTYLFYTFNYSWLTILIIATISILGLVSYKNKFNKNSWVLLVLVLAPYLIGHLYSVKVNPVIQYSTLIFSFPFLLALVFSSIEGKDLKGLYGILLIIFIGVVTFTSYRTWDNYHIHPFGNFKNASTVMHNWADELPEDNRDIIINAVNFNYYEYYLKQLDCQHQFLKTTINSEKDLGELSKHFANSNKENLIFSWSAVNNYYELKELMRYYFPEIKKLDGHFNYEVIHFTKGTPSVKTIDYYSSFESPNTEWNFNTTFIDTTNSKSGIKSISVTPEQEYPVSLKDIDASNFNPGDANIITFLVHFKSNQPIDALLAISIDNESGNQNWRGISLKEFNQQGQWSMGLVSIFLDHPLKENDKIKAYVWNRNHETFWLDDVSFYAYSDSKYYLKK